jgi:hypothetical protein
MVTTHNWSNDIFDSCPKSIQDTGGCVAIDFNIGRWIFFGCVIFGFLLVAYEARKSKKIVKSRDISYAFTNVMANHYYSLRMYESPVWCNVLPSCRVVRPLLLLRPHQQLDEEEGRLCVLRLLHL